MHYVQEFRSGWRPLLAATIGLGAGNGFTTLMPSIFAPHLLAEFGWSKATFALVATLTLITVVTIPAAGHLADRTGVRRTALIGIVALPISFLALATMTGGIAQYAAIFVAQSVLCVTTTITVYNRVVVRAFDRARGLALAICASGPALVGIVLNPALNGLVEDQGWRVGYLAVALYTAIGGGLALVLLRGCHGGERSAATAPSAETSYAPIWRSGTFWWIVCGLLLCNVIQVLLFSQMKLMLIEDGVGTAKISLMVALFSAGLLAGRFLTGLALDHFPTNPVAFAALGMPAIGLVLIASPFDGSAPIGLAVMLLGFSLGAEGDVISYMVARLFGLTLYSSVLGLMVGAISLSSALGAAILSLTLELTGSFEPFIVGAAISVAVGATMFLFVPITPAVADPIRAGALG